MPGASAPEAESSCARGHHVLEFDRVGTQQGDDHTYSNTYRFHLTILTPVRKEPFFSRNHTTYRSYQQLMLKPTKSDRVRRSAMAIPSMATVVQSVAAGTLDLRTAQYGHLGLPAPLYAPQ